MRSMLLIAFLFIFCAGQKTSAASYSFDYNGRCHEAYQKFMALQLEEGSSIIRKEIAANPYNLMAIYIADYEDCLLLLFNGDSREYEQRYKNLEERLKLIDRGDKNSPWYRLCKSGLNFHWALVNFRFGENLKAAVTFRKSFLLLKENKKLFPHFAHNKIFLGVEEAIVGTIPDDYKWIASIFGMKGNVKKGVANIASFVNDSDTKTPLRNEAVLYYCYLKFYLLSQQEEVWNYVNSSQFPVQNNLFHCFVKANLALNYRKADAALQTLKYAQTAEAHKRFPIFDYEMGSALLHKLDENAIGYLQRFLANYQSKLFVKDAWQKLAYSYYLQRNIEKADYCRKQIKVKGSAQVDADKQAGRFSESSYWPALSLVRARLLIDGGYYQQALAALSNKEETHLSTINDKLEYFFRLGRVYDELGDQRRALEFYQSTIDQGRSRREHYAARSALQMAMIYERSGKIAEAINKYNECLSMKNHDFQANIDQQAKAGLNRLAQHP